MKLKFPADFEKIFRIELRPEWAGSRFEIKIVLKESGFVLHVE
jgi:hypothetical protein